MARFLVIYHGNLSPRRGLYESIEAMAQVGPHAPDATLVLLGPGGIAGDLRALAARRGVADCPSALMTVLPAVIRLATAANAPNSRVPKYRSIA